MSKTKSKIKWRKVPYVKYWENESDYDGDWDQEEIFKTERQARKFIKEVLLTKEPVWAYEFGWVNEGTEPDYEPIHEWFEPCEFFNQGDEANG